MSKYRQNYYSVKGDDRCPIRTVYDDIFSDYWGDSYAGEVYIYVGDGQYFSMWVNG